MKMFLYLVYDVVAEIYLAPMFFATKRDAVHAFQEVCQDDKTKFFKHPDDFQFFEIGVLDLELGAIVPHSKVVPLGSAAHFQRREITPAAGSV